MAVEIEIVFGHERYTIGIARKIGLLIGQRGPQGLSGGDGGGTSLTVREIDGNPTSTPTILEFPNGSLTIPTAGTTRVAISAAGISGKYADLTGQPTLGTAAAQNTSAFESAGSVASAITSHLAAGNPHSQYATSAAVAAGYQPLDADLTSLAAASATNAIYYRSAADTWSTVTIGDNLTFSGGKLSASVSGGGGGTVTSVDASGGTTGFTFTGVPITGSGTITLAVSDKATARSAIGAGTSSFDGAYTSLTGTPSTFAPSAHTHAISDTTGLQAALDLKAPLANPALTGTPTAPTATGGTNTTQIATTAFVRAEVAGFVGSAPGALDTLEELAAALGDDPNFATTIATSLAGKQPLEATLTGIAATTPAANQIIYATGNDTFATTALTAFARSILDDADAGTVRATIGAGTSSIGTTANLPLITTTGGAITVGSFGTTASTFCEGSDSRLSNSRTPTAHTHTLGDITQSGATNGQVAAWNGSAWAPATVSGGGGSSGNSTLTAVSTQTSNYTATAGQLVPCNTSGGALTVTLPASPNVGDRVGVFLVTAGNNLTVSRNGNTIDGSASDLTISAVNTLRVLQYDGTTWVTVGAAGQSVLASNFTLTSTNTYQDTGLSVSLPTAGFYVINFNPRGVIQKGSAADGWIAVRLFNSTAGSAVADSDRLVFYKPSSDTTLTQIHSAYSVQVYIAAPTTIRLDGSRNSGGSPTWTFASIDSNSNGRTALSYQRIG
jgi:hypothetical protein